MERKKSMKRLAIGVFCILMLFGLWACSAKKELERAGLQTGVYVLESSEEELLPSVTLEEDGGFSFMYSLLSSYIPRGSYEVKKDRLVLTADREGSEKELYVFEIKEGKLIFLGQESAALPGFADEFQDGAVFVLVPTAQEGVGILPAPAF